MVKKANLAAALQNASSGKTESNQVIKSESAKDEEKKDTTMMPPSRQGKKAISGFFAPEVSKQLKKLALEENKTVQALLAEALNELFVKYNQKPIA